MARQVTTPTDTVTLTVGAATVSWVEDGGVVLGGSFVGNKKLCMSVWRAWWCDIEPVKLDPHSGYVFSRDRDQLGDIAACMLASSRGKGRLNPPGWLAIRAATNLTETQASPSKL